MPEEALNNPRKSESLLIKVHQMKSCSSDSPISPTLRPLGGFFGPSYWHLPTLQVHPPCSCLNNSFSHHPQAAQRKQCCQLRRVFDQAPIPSLAIANWRLFTLKGCSTLARMLALIFSNLSIKASTVLIFFNARRLPGIMATCQSTPGCCA